MTHNETIDRLEKEKFFDTLPVNLQKIADKYDINVNKEYIYQASGRIEKNADGKYSITLSVLHPITRQRFTLAHELAHFFLHKQEIGDGITDDGLYRSGLPKKIEVEANNLAADIIMPSKKMRERVAYYMKPGFHQYGLELSNILADEFRVSPEAMKIRMGL